MIKIIYTFSSLAKIAGTEKILTDKMNYLADKLNYEIYLITYEQGNHPYAFPLSQKIKHIDFNLRFIPLYNKNAILRNIKFYYLRKQYKKNLEKITQEINPDIIICTTYYKMEIHAISALKTNAIKIIESHLTKSFKKDSKKENSFIKKINTKFNDYIIDKYIKKFDSIVSLTQGDASLWKKVNKTFVIPNMISYYPKESCTYESKNVISVGRLTKEKGFDILIDAWKLVNLKFPEWHLNIFGEGECQNMLFEKIQQLGLEKKIHIQLPTKNIYGEYLNSAFFVMSSRSESFGLVLIEAMSCGLPCISFDCNFGPNEIIKNGKDGIIIKKRDSFNLANNIIYLINNKQLIKTMGEAAKVNVKAFLPERIMPLWENMFQTLLKDKK